MHRETKSWASGESTALVGIVLIFGVRRDGLVAGSHRSPGVRPVDRHGDCRAGVVRHGRGVDPQNRQDRGGPMQWQPSRAEVQQYRAEYRGSPAT